MSIIDIAARGAAQQVEAAGEAGATGEVEAVAAIAQVVAAVERTQRAKDAEGFLALFHPEALWTTAHGKVLIGFDAIAEFTRAVLPATSWDGDVTYEVVHTQFLRPDVAAVKVRQVYRSVAGDTEGAPLYVMTRQDDGRWLLTACQNTQVHTG
ncbi:SgcJ/EcaC family oxidoreductase [Streptomyces sp. ISL-86]|uniref:SgcJ/EcaC family oxidoreductase n=1 Tax=Streptomyces sp. ISL-86 TaxID=2819187 RepID=UPI001BE7F8BB|nr:SgcJ/EcaC family oxidoreductase [Streptomyces sp. ISL-86]MBT2454828.1 SgcJ/EcaC family oxidoreductase [Streptomyces sp. ISL-86]